MPSTEAPPHVVATAVWARGVGLARSGHATEAHKEIDHLQQIKAQRANQPTIIEPRKWIF